MILILPTVNHPKYIGSKHNLSKVVGHKLYWYFLFREFIYTYCKFIFPQNGILFLANFSDPVTQSHPQKSSLTTDSSRLFRNELFAAKELLTVACLFSSALLEDAVPCSWMHLGICGRGLELNGSDWKIMGYQWRAWVSKYTHIYTFSIHIEILNYVYTNIQL